MKNYLLPKPYRIPIDASLVMYTTFMLMLMTFLLATIVPFVRQRVPKEDLTMIHTSLATLPPIIVYLQEDGQYRLNTGSQSELPMSLETLRITLYKQFRVLDARQTPLCIQSDPTVPYQRIMEVMKLLQALDIQSIGLLDPL
jgi:biopolymer transport protein ExbD